MSRLEGERPRSVFRTYSGIEFVPTEEIRVGTSEYGDIVRITGRRGSDTEVVYTIKDTTTEIRGFEYENEGLHGFELLLFSSPVPEPNLVHIKRLKAIFQGLEQDCRRQGIQVLTTLALPDYASALRSHSYGFQPSGRYDARAIETNIRGSASAQSVSLFKMLQ